MPISIRKDVTYSLLKQIAETEQGQQQTNYSDINLKEQKLTEAELLGHLDYLNQYHYINAEFTGDGHPKKAELTDEGRRLLEKFEAAPKTREEASSTQIAPKDMPFLEKVMVLGNLGDVFDARDVTEIVFRIMRDLMTTEAAKKVEQELHKEALPTNDKALQMEIADLWHDTNPIVAFLSEVRPPWQGPGIFKIDSDRFLFRVANEGGLPPNVDRERAVKAVFAATKDELSPERIQEIASWLPEHVCQLWNEAKSS